ncbi:hypothetical protein K2173_022896 [Erythroxylum novogranatense]|uniref:Uncharacterized protein n=1 Tax=Erythroxylum novogranatense TaxID=1862640 RepID=A0AAV8TVM1_9ROSI|nr:hypothetical protein K2173_022896 [Erythroxylum novogranatense]
MPHSRFSGSLTSPKLDVAIDMGNPFLNLTIDGFLKIGTVAAGRALAEDSYHLVKRGNLSTHSLEGTLKKMCKEGAYWGTMGGIYVGMEYGMERIRGTRDWKNAMLGGVLTGALLSAASNKSKDRIVTDAITGGAAATAATFLNYFSSKP